MDRRLGRGAFFLIWFGLFAGQLGALANQEALGNYGLAAVIVGLQLAKLPFTAWRLADTGRPPSDAIFFILIPVVNVVGWTRSLFEATPKPAVWEKRRRAWSSQIGPFVAAMQAVPIMAKTALVGLPVVAAYGVIMALVGQRVLQFAEDAATMDATVRATTGQVFGGIAAVLLIYTFVQFGKRETASRLSWFPSIFVFPAVLVAGSLSFFEAGMAANLQLILLTFIYMAWQMVWMSIGGAALIVAVTLAANQVIQNGKVNAGEVFGQIGTRTLDVAGPHAARVQAVTVGMQIIIPGIFYMLQLAFADTVAVLKPEARSLKESAQLTWGMRARLFKLFLAATVLTMIVHFAVAAGMDGPEAALSYFIDPRQMSLASFAIGEVIWGISAWFVQVSLLLMYHDRVRYLEQRRSERRAKRDAKKNAAKSANKPEEDAAVLDALDKLGDKLKSDKGAD